MVLMLVVKTSYIHIRRRRPWMAGAVGGRNERRNIWKDSIKVPTILGGAFYSWMEDIRWVECNIHPNV